MTDSSPLRSGRGFPLGILMLNLFIALLGQGMVIPILPQYLQEFDAAGTAAGYLVAAFGAAQFIFSPIGGRMSDRFGRKRMILAGLFLTVISDYIFAVSYNLPALYIARFIGGIGLGIMVPSVLAYVADVTTQQTRAKGMGYLSAAMNLGMVLGPGLGGLIATYGIRVPYLVAAALGLVATIMTLWLKETLPQERRTAAIQGSNKPQTSMLQQLGQSFHRPYFRYLLLILVMTFGLMTYETVYSLYVEQQYGFTASEIAIIITLGAIVGIVVQVWLLDRVIRWLGEYRLIRLSLVVTAVALLLMLIPVNLGYLLAVSALFFAFNAFLRPTVNTLLANHAGDDEQGFVAGLNTTYGSIGSIIGPVVAGTLFDKHIELPYIVGAIILIATLALVRETSARQTRSKPISTDDHAS
ncbi:MFS transporter [Paenibacillus hunanensis]|uniref:DHA1 family multidrug resistance protein-like MFS transporter n=1 Tax=Paenibacillus hunanensis TaxID=539262 RepID=A0ABU1J0M0_9BACL|nr:MFS transporter [Paenibacillus hunanensis]MDR6245049.1 DHA1 family multidrug resistance protein-like MFS transporter [Paenibacillus hunanensis]GGI96393.1 tetracycline resistance MFS efflux pump [Paenibacillus hunanensis]